MDNLTNEQREKLRKRLAGIATANAISLVFAYIGFAGDSILLSGMGLLIPLATLSAFAVCLIWSFFKVIFSIAIKDK